MIKDTLQLLIKNNYERKYFLSDAFVSSDYKKDSYESSYISRWIGNKN